MTMIGNMPDEISKIIHDFIRPQLRTLVWATEREGGEPLENNNKPKPNIFNSRIDAMEYYKLQFNNPNINNVELVSERAIWKEHIRKYRTTEGKRVVVGKKGFIAGKYWIKLYHISKCKNVCSCCNVYLQTDFVRGFNKFSSNNSTIQNIKYLRSDCCEKILCENCAVEWYGGFFCKNDECLSTIENMSNPSDSDSDY